jgi:hypothetical protein
VSHGCVLVGIAARAGILRMRRARLPPEVARV